MARYIDADALSIYFDALAKHAEMEGLHNQAHLYKRCLQLVDDAPTADVAPRSEVAREIFEEIESTISPMLGLEDDKEYVAILGTTFAKLKKKYTEERTD